MNKIVIAVNPELIVATNHFNNNSRHHRRRLTNGAYIPTAHDIILTRNVRRISCGFPPRLPPIETHIMLLSQYAAGRRRVRFSSPTAVI